MARTRQFEQKKVIHDATILFCQKGYDGTSINDIVKATKLNRHSMYEIFKNKEGLFIECLYYFSYEVLSKLSIILNEDPRDIDSVKTYFKTLIEYVYSSDFHGCLYCATITHKGNIAPEILNVVERYFAQQNQMFLNCLINAKEKSQIPSNKNTEDLATFLQTSVIGIIIGVKTNIDRKTTEKVYENIVTTLTG